VAQKARDFGYRIQKAVEEKDLDALFALVPGELSNGPRKAFIQNKKFDQLFSEEWRERVLEDVPPCAPVGWRGFMLGNGYIWYRPEGIFSINGALEEVPEEKRIGEWLHDGRSLNGSCFTTIWYSGDNYEHFHETFAKNIDFATFSKFIGRYLGKLVPIEPIPNPWWEEQESLALAEQESLALAVKIPDCPRDDDEKTYQVLKEISKSHCASLAPNFPQGCEDIRLLTVIGPCGGSMGCAANTAIYTIINNRETKDTYMVPLVNFDSENDALNFLDMLKK